jgi:hypothetical protein
MVVVVMVEFLVNVKNEKRGERGLLLNAVRLLRVASVSDCQRVAWLKLLSVDVSPIIGR